MLCVVLVLWLGLGVVSLAAVYMTDDSAGEEKDGDSQEL